MVSSVSDPGRSSTRGPAKAQRGLDGGSKGSITRPLSRDNPP
jgi:hypothetical protein